MKVYSCYLIGTSILNGLGLERSFIYGGDGIWNRKKSAMKMDKTTFMQR